MAENNTMTDFWDIEPKTNKYSIWGIEYNPFPRSGTSNINGPDTINAQLVPLSPGVYAELNRFLKNAIVPNEVAPEDKFICATILGDYGTGKTQLLMYAKAKLNQLAESQRPNKPYTIYIDNPGVSVLEFIGRIISEVGEENIRKYIWNKIISGIVSSEDYQKKLEPYKPSSNLIWKDQEVEVDPFSDANITSYKAFLNAFIRQLPSSKKGKFIEVFGNIIMELLLEDAKETVVAHYFYEFITADFGVNKTWEAITNGNLRQISGKEAAVIGYIIHLIKAEGFTDVFILVDEFEDVTSGRLSKVQLDNYITNLRTLLDKQREWCLLFAMNPLALSKLNTVSPPLADRISARTLTLNALSFDEAKTVIQNYLSLAGVNDVCPFDDSAIKYMRDCTEGNIRLFLKIAFAIFESAADKATTVIDEQFIKDNMPSI